MRITKRETYRHRDPPLSQASSSDSSPKQAFSLALQPYPNLFFFCCACTSCFFFFLPQSLMTASGHRMSVFEVMETHGWLIITVLGASYMYLVFEVHAGTLQCWGKIHVCSTVAAFFLSFHPFFSNHVPRKGKRSCASPPSHSEGHSQVHGVAVATIKNWALCSINSYEWCCSCLLSRALGIPIFVVMLCNTMQRVIAMLQRIILLPSLF